MTRTHGSFAENVRSPAASAASAAALILLLAARPPQALAADNVLTFAATNHLVNTTGQVTNSAFSFEAWIKITSFLSENQIVCQYLGGNAGRTIVAARGNKASLFMGGTWFDGSAGLPSNTWVHIAVTRNGSTAKIYTNGVLDKTSTSFPTASISAANITIGGISQLNSGFRGQLADVRAWNAELTQPQIQSRKDSRLIGNEPNLAGYWPVNEGSGVTVYNRATPANGTIAGAAWAFSSDLPLGPYGTSGAWSASSGGSWSETAKWLGATPAQGAGCSVYFTNKPPAAIAVTNDLPALAFGRLFVSGPNSHTFAGSGMALTNLCIAGQIASTNGAHTFGVPLALAPAGASIESTSPAALTFANTVSGPGALSVNPAVTGAGAVTLSGANTFGGSITFGSGTLALSSIANGGEACSLGTASASPANLTLGPGTLSYTGPAAATDRGFTLQPGSGKAAILTTATNLTFGGTVNSRDGAFIKRGKGALTFTAPGTNTFSRAQAGNLNGFAEYPANGDSPLNGFAGLNVLEGKLTLGAAGQTNLVFGEAWIGIRTTALAGKEVTGELEINGGYTRMASFMCVGRDNGTASTAPQPLQPRLTVKDGTLSTLNLIIAYGNTTNNTRPVVDVYGGSFEIDSELRFGDQRGDALAPMVATMNVFGGQVLHTNVAPATQGMIFGWRDPAASGTLNLFAGLVDERYLVKLGQYGSTSRLNLHGGVLRAQNIVQSNVNTNYGQSLVFFNGGVFQPNAAGQTLSGLTSATVSTNGARIDTSLADYAIGQNLLHDGALGGAPDGGLVKLGANTLTLSSYGSTYTGASAVSNGTLCVAGALPAANALVAAAAGEILIGGSATQTVSAASLTLADEARLGFALATDGASNDRLAVSATPALAGKRIALYLQNTRLPFTKNGTYTLLTYGGSAPDITGLSVANAVYGKAYTFAAAAGALAVTIASDAASASVWNVDAAGDWSEGSNWTVAQPGTAGSGARFDDAITAPVTVATAGQTVGSLFFNSAVSYTLGGTGLTLDNDASPAAVTVESGAHTVAAPLTLAGDAALSLAPSSTLTLGPVTGAVCKLAAQGNSTLAFTAPPVVQSLELNVQELAFSNALTVTAPVVLQRAVTVRPAPATTAAVSAVVSGAGSLAKAGSNVLELASANTYTGVTRIDGGMLKADTLANGGQPSSIGASPAGNGNLLLGPGTLRYTGPAAVSDRGYTLQSGTGRAAVLDIDNAITFAGKIQGTSGGFIKTGPGTLYLTYPGPQTIGVKEGNIDVVQSLSPFGEGPTAGFQAFTISRGKVVVGVPGQTNTVAERMCIGHCTTTTGSENACELEINGGAFNGNSTVSLGRSNGTTVTAPGGISSRITVNNGAVTFSLLALGFNNVSGLSGFNARPVCDVNAGTLTISSYCNIGESAGSAATVNVRGGTFRANGKHGSVPAGILIGGPASAGNGTLNVAGTGVVYCVNNIALATVANATGTLNLNGGQLSASNIIKQTTGSAYLRFNGGVYQPLTAAAALGGLSAAYVSTNGALIDTSLANGYTVAQDLLADPALGGAADGGLVKLGTNTLAVTATGSTFKGPIEVRAGLLKARVCSTNDLCVSAGAAFDALGERATVGDLTGFGPLTNGVIAVAGTLDAGTNGSPAGAKMTVQNLSLLAGATFACNWATNGAGKVTNDFVTVTGALAPEGSGFVDFGRTEANPIPMPFSTTVMSYGSLTGAFAGWKPLNTGLPASAHPALVVTAESGLVKIEVRYIGTLLLLQ